MSDNYLFVVPSDPFHRPTESEVSAAVAIAARVFVGNDGIEVSAHSKPQFFDAMSNFDSVSCPTCGGVLEMEWWADRMDADHDGEGFRLLPFETPCCNVSLRLNDLEYVLHCAFAKLAIEILNPGVETVSNEISGLLERALGTKVAFVHAHF